MFMKSTIVGTLVAIGMAISSPSQAADLESRYGVQFGNGQSGVHLNVDFRGHRRGVSKRFIRRQVRHFGCYDISRVKRHHRRFKVKATCDYGTRVRMIFSARSGRLLRENIIGYDRHQRRNHRQYRHWRG